MSIWIYDSEVFCADWVFCFKKLDEDEWRVVHNDGERLREFLREEKPWLGGFNNKHYDTHILRAASAGFLPEQVKEVNDYIIADGIEGWQIPMLRDVPRLTQEFDLMDDCQMGLSLKAIEAHLGMSIVESSVPFDIDRALTEEELKETIRYCMYDVEATEKLYHLREKYLDSKMRIGSMCGLSDVRSCAMTNARLTAAFLGAKPKEYGDERCYVIPDNLKREYIPREVFEFFARMYDANIPDDELFSGKLNLKIGETEVTIGYGGIHAGIPNYQFEKGEK